ncbi:MAG TPA: ankyrin repeat domain-containing protein [Pyrinomonadaceae bacterium]|nr:ankyrin repeat domain-containing protein [Pyrinomonadaceae bacterium]
MRLTSIVLMIMAALVVSFPAAAQNAQQQLNDEMWEAVRQGNVVLVTSLLDKGADVNAKFRYGTTALFKAAERGHTEVVKLLIARGADVTVKDTFYGATAMTWALNHNHTEVIKALLEKDGSSVGDVLMNGVREGKVPLVEIALARGGAKPEALTAALAIAASDKEKAQIAEMLKKAGAQPPLQVDAATLQSYVGKYKTEQGIDIAFNVKDGKLFATATGQQPLEMMALDKSTFRPVAFDGFSLTFNVEGDKASGFTFKQGATTMQYKRVEETKQP